MSYSLFSGVGPLQRQQWVLPCNCLLDASPYSHYVMPSFPLCGVMVLHPARNSITIMVTAKKKRKQMVPWLSSSRSDWHVLQRRRQSTPIPDEGGGRTPVVHGCSRMTIDPRIPMPGRSTPDFHQPGRHCLHQARSTVRCSASRMKGELHPSKNHSQDGLRHLVPTFLLMNDSADELYFVFVVWGHSRDSSGYCYVTASWVPRGMGGAKGMGEEL